MRQKLNLPSKSSATAMRACPKPPRPPPPPRRRPNCASTVTASSSAATSDAQITRRRCRMSDSLAQTGGPRRGASIDTNVSAEPLLELCNATLFRGDAQVLHGVNLTISQGEHTAIVGPNGAGKSSLIRLLTVDS